jgi:hypothetical protein
MLDDLRNYEKLGSKDELQFMLFKAIPTLKRGRLSNLKNFCSSNYFSIGGSFEGIVKLLEYIELIHISNNYMLLRSNYFDHIKDEEYDTYLDQDDFIGLIFRSLQKENAISSFFNPNSIKRNVGKNQYYIKDSYLPLRYINVRNLLLSLGFFIRDDEFGTGNLLIRENSTNFFTNEVVRFLLEEQNNKIHKITLEQLKANHRKQEEFGEEAETFVLDYENKRLGGHPLLKDVKRISEEYVNAGFDIVSFNDLNSVFIDRFIEVKSYSRNVSFFMSQNEIEVAQQEGDKYCLYLVDRDNILTPGYIPKIFKDPFQNIINNIFWNKESTTWRISPKQSEFGKNE